MRPGDAAALVVVTWRPPYRRLVPGRMGRTGAVEVEPYDIGPTRSSIIRDPGGARFAANAFNPG